MGTEIKVFENSQFGQVRTWTDENGVLWYCAKDICDYLEYGNVTEAMRKHVQPSDMIKHKTFFTNREEPTKKHAQSMVYINKGGFYSLVLNSKMPKAREFYYAVTHEVLPSIEQTGAYMTPAFIQRLVDDPDLLIAIATQVKQERKRNAMLTQQNQVLSIELAEQREKNAEQKAYIDYILSSDKAVNTTQIAKDYGMSAKAFNGILFKLHIQYKTNGQWVPYQEYAGKGYTTSHTYSGDKPNGDVWTNNSTWWTQLGREFLYNKLKEQGIYPLIERHC